VRSHAWASLAKTLLLAGQQAEAGRAARETVAIRIAKGDVTGASALEQMFGELGL
jgi:hypothetical protein